MYSTVNAYEVHRSIMLYAIQTRVMITAGMRSMSLFLLHQALLQPPAANQYTLRGMKDQGRKAHLGIFFSFGASPVDAPDGAAVFAPVGGAGAGRGTTFSMSSALSGAGYPVATRCHLVSLSGPAKATPRKLYMRDSDSPFMASSSHLTSSIDCGTSPNSPNVSLPPVPPISPAVGPPLTCP